MAYAFLISVVSSVPALQGPHAQFVTMTDGLMIDIDLRWPDGSPPPGGWPAMLLAHGRGGSKTSLTGLGESFADDEYVTLAYSGRGDGASTTGGDPSDTSAAMRGQDIADLIAWLINDMPTDVSPAVILVDGANIGMTGTSQGGINTWYSGLVAGGVKAIAPRNFAMHAWSRGFLNNGSFIRNIAGFSNVSPLVITHDTASLEAGLASDDLTGDIPSMTVPVMTQHAMHDSWGEAGLTFRDYLAATGATERMVYIGTGGHGTSNADNAYRNAMRSDWLDFWLKGEANGILSQARIHFSLLDTWEKVTFDTFPHPDEVRFQLYMNAAGALSHLAPTETSGSDSIVNNAGSYTVNDAASSGFSSSNLIANFPQDTVVYRTEPLAEEIVILGFPVVRLHVESTATDRYQLNVHLTDDAPGAVPRLLAYGTYTVEKSASPSGATLEFDLSVTGRRVAAGNRLGLRITNLDTQNQVAGGSPIIRYVPVFDVGTTTVYRSSVQASWISIPVIEGSLPAARTAARHWASFE